jgi:hypothetical protein
MDTASRINERLNECRARDGTGTLALVDIAGPIWWLTSYEVSAAIITLSQHLRIKR